MQVKKKSVWRKMYKQRHLYILLLPALIVTFLFNYCPMPGLIMAFEDFNIYDGLWGSEWVGLENIKKIWLREEVLKSVGNTLYLSFLGLLINFPAPIILALLINEIKNMKFKKVVQTTSYLPHFLSTISIVGIVQLLFSKEGLFNDLRMALGASERIGFLGVQEYFVPFIVGTSLWQGVGWGTIVHLANLSSIDPTLYEAAEVDGAKHLQKLWYITLPHMIPTVIILLIFQMGNLFSSNFELVYGLQNPFIEFEVISTIIYKLGLQSGDYSMSTAVGFVQGLIALLLVATANKISKWVTGSGLW